jgi:hypothetical protein
MDIPVKITRNTKTKNIEMKRMKKDYRIVYNKRVIVDDYRTYLMGTKTQQLFITVEINIFYQIN